MVDARVETLCSRGNYGVFVLEGKVRTSIPRVPLNVACGLMAIGGGAWLVGFDGC